MGWTKRQLIDAAFSEIGLAAYVFDLQAEQLQAARRMMDAMMGEWAQMGIHCGYTVPVGADGSDMDDDSGVTSPSAVYLNLALRLAPSYGKEAGLGTMGAARRAYTALIKAMPPERGIDTSLTPAGAGNRRKWLQEAPTRIDPTELTI